MLAGYWHEHTAADFAHVDGDRGVAVLPVSAIEQHGPHLPLNTDACINAGIVGHALDRVAEDVGMLVMPQQRIGDSTEHTAFSGTIAAEPETLIPFWTQIGDSVARAGITKLVIFNTHGGQPQVVDQVAMRLRRRWGMLVVGANLSGLGVPDDLIAADELRHGIHGGQLETSIMLHLRPDLVRWENVRRFPSLAEELAETHTHLRPTGRLGFAWMAQDLNAAGVVGDASKADGETGRRIVDHCSAGLAQLIAETARFPLSTLRDRREG